MLMNRSSFRLSIPDAIILAAGIVLLIAFLVLPWISPTPEVTLTGVALMGETEPPTASFRMLIEGVPIAGVLAVIVGAGAALVPALRGRVPTLGLIAGLMALTYFVMYSIANLQNPRANLLLGIGHSIAALAGIALVTQVFLPRGQLAIGDSGNRWRGRAGLLFLMPGVLWVLVFTIFPLLYSLLLAFTNARLGRARAIEITGLTNFARIFTDQRVRDVLPTTIFLVFGSLILTLVLGTLVAWLFNHDIPGLRTLRAILTMPLFAAPIALGYLGVVIFNEQNGPLNHLIRGLGGTGISWFTEPWAARIAVMLTDVWQWMPFVFIVILAAMQSIPDELTEAAHLDTANGWQIFRHITFPLIAPALGTVALLRLVETFKILDIPITLTGGGPGQATQTYTYYAYLTGLREFEMGYGSALAYLLVIIATIISGIYFWRVRARFD